MKKTEKQLFVENLTEELKSSKSLVILDYVGLSVKNQQELKKRLKEVGAKMLVVKNTLLKRAGNEAKLNGQLLSATVLSGPTAIVATQDDPIAPLQVLAKFSEEFEIPQFKVGIIDGTFQEKENLIKLSKLPGKNILYSQVYSSIASPIFGLLGLLQGNMQKLIYLLNEKAKS